MVFESIRKAHERNKGLPERGKTTINYDAAAAELATVYWHVDDDVDFQLNKDNDEDDEEKDSL